MDISSWCPTLAGGHIHRHRRSMQRWPRRDKARCEPSIFEYGRRDRPLRSDFERDLTFWILLIVLLNIVRCRHTGASRPTRVARCNDRLSPSADRRAPGR